MIIEEFAMKVPLLDLKAQYACIRDEIRTAIDEVCDSQQFILGERVQIFERHVAEYCGAKYAVGVSSGTDALLSSLMALDIGPGHAVITTPFTFFSTAGSIARTGAVPIFADIDPVTFNVNPESIRQVLTSLPKRFSDKKVRALLPVHLFGQCSNMDSIMDLAGEFGCHVIEDAAQAIGAEYPSRQGMRKAGIMGDMGCFSFFPSKNLGAFGDGGMVTTSNPELDDKLRSLRGHGASVKYYHKMIGANFRLDALQAAVLDVKLNYLESWHASRRANAEFYNKAFEATEVDVPISVYADSNLTNPHIYNQYVIRVPNRDQVRDRLKAAEIGCEIYYPVPLHLQECFSYLGYRKGDFPESEKTASEVLALPVYQELTEDMIQRVVETVLKAL